MSKEHAKIAKQIPGSVIRCGPRRMLQYICEKCGSGQEFKAKSGKSLRIPKGRFQCTDKEMMQVLGIESRRVTMREYRLVIKKKLRGAVTIKHEFKQGCRYPVIVYHVDLEKLKELIPKERTENVHHNQTESVQDDHTETVRGRTETDTHTGFPSETGVAVAGNASASVTPLGGDEIAEERTQRSAARRSASRADAYPKTIDHKDLTQNEKSVWNCINDLVEVGYEANPSLGVLTRIVACLEADLESNPDLSYSVGEVFEYVSKAKWILETTQGRLEWLADRFESQNPRSLLNQFHSFIASRRRHEAETERGLPDKTVLQGFVADDQQEEIGRELDPALEGNLKAFTMVDECEHGIEIGKPCLLCDQNQLCTLPAGHGGECQYEEV
jgi:hypothetical protein